ncbi:MAG: VWA domain-containing protein [Gammaproteobacteria bacterium]|nr:VWA domain-containing protein [Gammaproteobacteria bacterium]
MSFIYNFQDIYWREPLWLILALQPFIILVVKNSIKGNNFSLYAEKKLQPWVVMPMRIKSSIFFNKNTAYVWAWIFFAIALSGPRTPISQTDKEQLFAANIMLVVDLSPSMQATDIIPNRIRRAKIEIYEFLQMLGNDNKAGNHRVGITVFSARSHVYVPLTSDHTVLKTYLESLDTLELPTKGSDPVAAILLAKKELSQREGKSAIVLITDGNFSENKNLKNKQQFAQLTAADTPLYILGIGTVEGEAVQLKNGSWLKHNGQAVISKMDEDHLRQFARQLGGKYTPVYDDDSDWETLYAEGLSQHRHVINMSNKQQVVWDNHFIYFLFPALLLFWLSLSPYSIRYIKDMGVFVLAIAIFGFIPNNKVMAFDLNNLVEFSQKSEQAAFRAYQKENYKQADILYQTVPGYRGHFGQGNSLYKMGYYQKAIQQFTLAVLNSDTDSQRADALYNLANSYFHSGAFTLAITSYNDVLRYRSNDKAALYNKNISQVLNKNLQRRLREREKIISSARPGRGAQTSAIADGVEISENSSVSMDGSENNSETEIPLPDLPDINEDKLRKLIALGLKNIKLAKQGDDSLPFLAGQYGSFSTANSDLFQLQQKLYAMPDSNHLLWKRLFEIEEGFPAPLETPRTLPGVNPW